MATIEYRVGSMPGSSARIKIPNPRAVKPPSQKIKGILAGKVDKWRRVAFITSMRAMDRKTQRLWILLPCPGAQEVIQCRDFSVSGEFMIESVENNSRRANEAWKAFIPA